MVEQINVPYPIRLLRKRCRVRTISVGTRLERLVAQLLERQRDTRPVRHFPDDILSPLHGRDLGKAETIFPDLPFLDIELRLLLPEKETESLNPVIEREGADLQ